MITIIDYGVGNITSVVKAFEFMGLETRVTTSVDDVSHADFLVVPGQGACGQAMAQLEKLGLIEPIKAHIAQDKPFLGICLGFQILFESSEEHGGVETLGVFKGHVEKFSQPGLKVPHMGWNKVEDGRHFYFVHSYYVKDADPEIVALRSDYGGPFVAAVRAGNVWGTQFHPEKSGDVGLAFLKEIVGG